MEAFESERHLEDLVDDFLLGGGLEALGRDEQCWGAMLAGSCGCRTSDCTAGFVRGKNHLKNKFCDACRRHGVYVRVDRVWMLADSAHEDFANNRGAGLWTPMPSHPSVGFRLINQSHKCKGPWMIVCDRELTAALTSCAPPDDRFVIDGRWVHLRVANGTLCPSLDVVLRAHPEPRGWEEAGALQWVGGDGAGSEHDDRGTKRARVPNSVDGSAASPSSLTSQVSRCPQSEAEGDAGMWPADPPPALLDESGAIVTPSLDALLTAHAEFGAHLAAVLGSQSALALSSDQHTALAALLHHVRTSAALLRSGGGGGVADEEGLLSWPPSPPGTAAGGVRLCPQANGGAGGQLSITGSHLATWRPPPAVAVSARRTSTPGRAAVLYFNLLILCVSAFCGQFTMALLTYLFPGLVRCGSPHYDGSPIIVTYGCVVSIMLAANFVLAEAVGLIPTGCALAGPPHLTHTRARRHAHTCRTSLFWRCALTSAPPTWRVS